MAIAPDPTQPTRQLASAGRACLVVLLALLIGSVLNAPVVYKNAYNRPDGWQRDVAMKLARPLLSVSDALRLDEPRRLVQDAVGRSGVDSIDVSITAAPLRSRPHPGVRSALPAPAAERPSSPAHPVPGKPVFTPAHPLRVWVAGDSLVITPGYALVRTMDYNHAAINVGGVDGRLATGLTRPDAFNWFSEIRRQVDDLHPDVVVIAFGGNDAHAYMTGVPSGISIGAFDGAAWRREYERRVGIVLDTIHRGGALAIWVGLPVVRSASQSRRFAVINAAVREEVERHASEAEFVATAELLAGPSGGFAQYLRVGGSLVDVRAPDGVHLAPAGGAIVAHRIVAIVQRSFDITSWNAKRRASS